LQRSLEAKCAAVIEIRMPQEASTPGATLEQIREQGRKMRGE
jgi:acetolactate synthase-1/2/3 large subunit